MCAWRAAGGGGAALDVLVVEDEQRVARVILAILERAGHRVALAGALREAAAALSSSAYDVIIADFILPDGDGLAFARQARSEHGAGAIVMSGLADIPDSDGLISLAKPFTPDQLERALTDAVATVRRPG